VDYFIGPHCTSVHSNLISERMRSTWNWSRDNERYIVSGIAILDDTAIPEMHCVVSVSVRIHQSQLLKILIIIIIIFIRW